MRVSVSLHSKAPSLDGNQRDGEALYCGYNRQYAELLFDKESGGYVCRIKDLEFPRVQHELGEGGVPYTESLTHVSIGVALAPDGMGGGAIINMGPLDVPIVTGGDLIPRLTHCLIGVFAARLDAMVADGRLVPGHVAGDPMRGWLGGANILPHLAG